MIVIGTLSNERNGYVSFKFLNTEGRQIPSIVCQECYDTTIDNEYIDIITALYNAGLLEEGYTLKCCICWGEEHGTIRKIERHHR